MNISCQFYFYIYFIAAVEPEISYEQSAAERREAASEFVEVSAEEFASVSDLIRGRAKLEDVNKVSFTF